MNCSSIVEKLFQFDRTVPFPSSRGTTNSHIYFHSDGRWRLESFRFPSSKYFILKNSNPNVLPLGTHVWLTGWQNALCSSDHPAGTEAELTLSKCFFNKYTCNSGDCVDLR